MIKYSIYTDGSCLGNPGPGGWAFLLKSTKDSFSKSGTANVTTNNRMEMQAMIEGFLELKKTPDPASVAIYSDSRLIINTLTLNWKRKTNLDLWTLLDQVIADLTDKGWQIEWHWVKGHAGHTENEIVNDLAQKAAASLQKNMPYAAQIKSGPAKSTLIQTKILPPSEEDAKLRNIIEENSFNCSACKTSGPGILSRKTATGPVRVDCSSCGKYIKFAKQSK